LTQVALATLQVRFLVQHGSRWTNRTAHTLVDTARARLARTLDRLDLL
jgi:hypothetical protein